MADGIVRVVIADMPEVKAGIDRLRAALDEANTKARVLEETARSEAAARAEAEAERDEAVAQVEAVKALCTYWEKLAPGDRYYASRVRAHLADTENNGDAPKQQPFKPAIGDMVTTVLTGELIGYDSDAGKWQLRGSASGGHVAWAWELHWATEFERAQDGATT